MNSVQGSDPFQALPPEVSLYILNMVDEPQTALVSSLWNNLAQEHIKDAFKTCNKSPILQQYAAKAKSLVNEGEPEGDLKRMKLLAGFVFKRAQAANINYVKQPLSIQHLEEISLAVEKRDLVILIEAMTHFYFSHLSLDMLKHWFEKNQSLLEKVTELKSFEKKLTALPKEIKYCKNLQTLDLTDNFLTTLPPEMASLTKLTHLSLNSNPLATLPTVICSLINLEKLELDSTQLVAVPAEIGLLKKLQYLDLSNNQLTTTPTEIGSLIELRTLLLNSNQFTAIPDEIYSLPHLEILGTWYNPLPPPLTEE